MQIIHCLGDFLQSQAIQNVLKTFSCVIRINKRVYNTVKRNNYGYKYVKPPFGVNPVVNKSANILVISCVCVIERYKYNGYPTQKISSYN